MGCGQSPGQIFEFETPFRKFGTGEARNFKFSTLIDHGKSHLNSDKIPQKGRGQRLGAEILNFKTPYLNLEWVKLKVSNLVYG